MANTQDGCEITPLTASTTATFAPTSGLFVIGGTSASITVTTCSGASVTLAIGTFTGVIPIKVTALTATSGTVAVYALWG